MAWTEQVGPRSWRVRYPTGDGHTASVSGFTSKLAGPTTLHEVVTPGSDGRGSLRLPPMSEDWLRNLDQAFEGLLHEVSDNGWPGVSCGRCSSTYSVT